MIVLAYKITRYDINSLLHSSHLYFSPAWHFSPMNWIWRAIWVIVMWLLKIVMARKAKKQKC